MALSLALVGCVAEPGPADLGTVREPRGAVQSPDGAWLFVTNANLDARDLSSTLVAIDLVAALAALDDPQEAGAALSDARPCRTSASDKAIVECDVAAFIDPAASVRLPSGAGALVVDRPFGDAGPWRLITPSAVDPALSWIDVTPVGGGLRVECGQGIDQRCDAAHTLTHRFNDADESALPADGARLRIDEQGFRYAYLPHLLGSVSGDAAARRGGQMTLIALDGRAGGPEIVDVEGKFYRPTDQDNSTYAGGFAVASRPCDPTAPAEISDECRAPYLVTSHRYWPGIREFTVASASRTVQARGDIGLIDSNPAVVEDRPYNGDLRFEDESGDRLLMVVTAPPALMRLDTSLADDGGIRADVIQTEALCDNPNLLALSRPIGGDALAFVACYGDDAIAVIGLGSFTRVATIAVGDGPNEMIVDEARRRLYVTLTLDDAVAVIDLDSRSERFLAVIGRLAARSRLD